jgi:ABC-type transporter Mla subunit MlaD
MSDDRPDPLGDVITLLAAPIAGGLRSIEQAKRGVDELFRAVENLNRTMENLNAAAERINRFMADVEEPVRVMLPQLTRTVKAADEMMEIVGGPAKRVAPNMARIAETLTSPTFTALPNQLNEFMTVMSDMSRRLGPLAQFAESAGGMFGLRFPGMPGRQEPPVDAPPSRPAAPSAASAAPKPAASTSPTTTSPANTTGATTTGAKRTAATTTGATKTGTKKTGTKKSGATRSTRSTPS